jgi:ABC-type sugar transport system, permease component
MWYFIFTMLFSGGLIPLFIVVNKIGLYDNFMALILPSAVQVFNVIIMMNFFKSLPPSISESAMIDGAGHWRNLCSIYIPLSLPSVATLTLFAVVFHWNDYFTGLFLMSNNTKWPLQTFLYSMLNTGIDYSKMNPNQVETLASISDRSLRAAQILIAMIPIFLVYPFLQRYFVTGLTIGSVKE